MAKKSINRFLSYGEPTVTIRKAVLIVPAVVTLVLSIAFMQGMRATDDLRYAQYSMSLLSGGQSPPLSLQPDHREARIGLTYPVAAIFSVFGPNDISLALLPLVCTVLTASLVAWLAYWFWGDTTGLIAGLLFAIFPLTIGQSTFCVPEPILDFELCLATALFLWAHEPQVRNAACAEFLAGALVGVAYLTTEVGALLLPALCLYGVIARRIRVRDLWLLAGFAGVFLAELAYHAVVHGDPLYRFTLATGYLSDPMLVSANRNLTYRLLKSIPEIFVVPNSGVGVLGPLMAVAGIYGLLRWRQSLLFVVWAALILLFYNFMTASFRHYVALPVTPRLLAPASLPLLVLAGKLLVDVWHRIERIAMGSIRYMGRTLLAVGAAGTTAMSILVMYLNTGLGLTGAIALNAKHAAAFLSRYSSATIITDQITGRAIQFYRRYNPRDSYLRLGPLSRSDDELQGDSMRPVFVVMNGPVIHEDQLTGELYGTGGLLGPADRASLSRLSLCQGSGVFSASLRRGPVWGWLVHFALVRYLLGPWSYGLTERLYGSDPPLGQVRVFRRCHGDRADGRSSHRTAG